MEHVKAKVKIEMWQQKILGSYLILMKRITFTPSGKDFITDYGICILSVSFWINFAKEVVG